MDQQKKRYSLGMITSVCLLVASIASLVTSVNANIVARQANNTAVNTYRQVAAQATERTSVSATQTARYEFLHQINADLDLATVEAACVASCHLLSQEEVSGRKIVRIGIGRPCAEIRPIPGVLVAYNLNTYAQSMGSGGGRTVFCQGAYLGASLPGLP